jgi:hypothetical protein
VIRKKPVVAPPIGKIDYLPTIEPLKIKDPEFVKRKNRRRQTWNRDVYCLTEIDWKYMGMYYEQMWAWVDAVDEKIKAHNAAIDKWRESIKSE